MRKIASLTLILIVLLEIPAAPQLLQKKPAGTANQKPRLVLAIIVDQFRYDYLLRFGNDFSDGLKQLLARGAVFANARYEHYPTFTSVGHSAFL
jgi:predicted AlkP superfamily pyrophosphatase or phosphodiesterase